MQIKRIDDSIPLPSYATPGSAALDMYVRGSYKIEPKSHLKLPLNIIAKAPEGYFLALLPRSSTFKKTGLLLTNGLGIIDPDYHGTEDEICAVVYNTSTTSVSINHGDRMFQLLVLPFSRVDLEEVSGNLKAKSRGGYGSTDRTDGLLGRIKEKKKGMEA